MQQTSASEVAPQCPLSLNSTYLEVEDSVAEVGSEELPEPDRKK